MMSRFGGIIYVQVLTNSIVCSDKMAARSWAHRKHSNFPLMKTSETTAVKAWEAKWGFTKDIYPEMYSQINEVRFW